MEEDYLKLTTALTSPQRPEPGMDEFLKSAVERKIFHGSHTLQETGVVPQHIYFIIKGIARICFWYSDDSHLDHKMTSAFIREGGFAFTLHSFFEQVPCIQSIELISAGRVFSIHYRVIKEAAGRFLDMNAYLEKLKDRYYEQLKERSFVLSMPLVKDRYRYLAAHKAWLFQHVPMEYIATYMGTTRENLSRIRSRYG